jgi:hypothetical protein
LKIIDIHIGSKSYFFTILNFQKLVRHGKQATKTGRDTGKRFYTEPLLVHGLHSSDPYWIFRVREYSGSAILKYRSGSKRTVKDPIWTFLRPLKKLVFE